MNATSESQSHQPLLPRVPGPSPVRGAGPWSWGRADADVRGCRGFSHPCSCSGRGRHWGLAHPTEGSAPSSSLLQGRPRVQVLAVRTDCRGRSIPTGDKPERRRRSPSASAPLSLPRVRGARPGGDTAAAGGGPEGWACGGRAAGAAQAPPSRLISGTHRTETDHTLQGRRRHRFSSHYR